jgi:hypothetical protein
MSTVLRLHRTLAEVSLTDVTVGGFVDSCEGERFRMEILACW